MMKSRKQRKLEAKQNGVSFVPQYNGSAVVSFEDYYGLGIERFNNKFVKFDNNVEKTLIQEPLLGNEEEKIEIVKAELVEDTPRKKKGKFKKALKKLFNK